MTTATMNPEVGGVVDRSDRTAKKRQAFLAALAETANVLKSSEIARIARRTVYDWKSADSEFADAWERALDIGTDALEDEAVRRAHDGVDEPVFYQGKACGVVRKYSDTLLIFLLKGRRPEKYRDRPSHATGVPDDGPVFFKVTVPVMSDKLAGHTHCRAEIVPPRPSLPR